MVIGELGGCEELLIAEGVPVPAAGEGVQSGKRAGRYSDRQQY